MINTSSAHPLPNPPPSRGRESNKIVLATTNLGKIGEFQKILSPNHFEIIPQSVFDIPEAEETGLTFVENAIIKARHATLHSHLPAISDDSGIIVDALNGEPGIYSARYAGPKASASAHIAKLLTAIQNVPDEKRTARFCCVLVYMRHALDPTPIIVQAFWEGKILFTPSGQEGFGYDPIFFVPTHGCSAAELAPQVKNRISHRGQALQQLVERLQ